MTLVRCSLTPISEMAVCFWQGQTGLAGLSPLDAVPDAADGLEVGLAEHGVVAHQQRRALRRKACHRTQKCGNNLLRARLDSSPTVSAHSNVAYTQAREALMDFWGLSLT